LSPKENDAVSNAICSYGTFKCETDSPYDNALDSVFRDALKTELAGAV